MKTRHRVFVLITWGFALYGAPTSTAQPLLPGFERDPKFGEQTMTFLFEPNVRVHINAPASLDSSRSRPLHLILYALPNGNTIEQTAGKHVGEGVDWHFGIQHIAAQTRLLRQRDSSSKFVVAYLEASSKSWPAWRRTTPNSSERIVALVDTIRSLVSRTAQVTLSAHSGGGSFLFGFINSADSIPTYIERFLFLDANYGFTEEERHGRKLLEWLHSSDHNALIVTAYDDRNITLNGKLVVGPTGGTYRRSLEMIDFFSNSGVHFTRSEDTAFVRQRSDAPAILISVHKNQVNEILHTILVEKNGFIAGLTAFTPAEVHVALLWGPVEYAPFIQP